MEGIAARELLMAAATLAGRRCPGWRQGGNAASNEGAAGTVCKTFLTARIDAVFRLIEAPKNSCLFALQIRDDVVVNNERGLPRNLSNSSCIVIHLRGVGGCLGGGDSLDCDRLVILGEAAGVI